MKKVFSSNEQLSHVWARQSQSEGRAGSMSFNGGILFSYNTAIAELCTAVNGEKIALLNNASYSNSTCKHQSLAWRALSSDYKKISVLEFWEGYRNTDRLKLSNQNQFDQFAEHNEKRAADLLVKASRARVHSESYNGQAYDILKAIDDYAQAFDFEYSIKTDLNQLREASEASAKVRRDQEAAEHKERIIKQAENLQGWRDGQVYSGYFEYTALRVNQANQTIETSRGANIPLNQANNIWRLTYAIHKKQTAIDNLNFKIGHYTLNSYKNGDFTIGCHVINFTEFSLLALQLGFITLNQLQNDLNPRKAA